ncbi:mandelate racemase/muconate lactonizing enzyme family protein [Parapedobacter indicus]|uniref:Dipeptide epimerase n=1 Tax=Parapedobacter indicus TaxID=1477437 RepID=A0A1I3KEC0_9SPHI|nr:dipeptide epimerase [Parapedobacter indicus]PPL01797.1 L-alanine-DL-glutamate epimerase-like enolase superfamily enzyme [Parapedobacter indicus]SFI70861.1 L-alanine-DL-glutamate epimerase [Parapedobacter indicus]
MIISHIDIYRFSIPMVPFAIATGTMLHAQNVFIRVHTNENRYGVGECSAFPMIVGETQDTCLVVAREFARLWKGRDPMDIESRMQELHHFIDGNSTIKSAFDMCLYDLAAKNAGQPLWQFLGGEKRQIITDVTVGIATVDEMADQAMKFVAQGATILKIKLGNDIKSDLKRLAKIRRVVGPDILIRVDANQGWSYTDALNILQAMRELDIEFCEQPMRSWNDHLLPKLRSLSSVRIMADESCYDHHDAQRLIAAGACDAINIKLAKSGGIHEALQLHHVAQHAGIPCMMGGMLESRIALSANLHLIYACRGIVHYDMDSCLIGHLADPVVGGVQYTDFTLNINDEPGLGADADEQFLKNCERITI